MFAVVFRMFKRMPHPPSNLLPLSWFWLSLGLVEPIAAQLPRYRPRYIPPESTTVDLTFIPGLVIQCILFAFAVAIITIVISVYINIRNKRKKSSSAAESRPNINKNNKSKPKTAATTTTEAGESTEKTKKPSKTSKASKTSKNSKKSLKPNTRVFWKKSSSDSVKIIHEINWDEIDGIVNNKKGKRTESESKSNKNNGKKKK